MPTRRTLNPVEQAWLRNPFSLERFSAIFSGAQRYVSTLIGAKVLRQSYVHPKYCPNIDYIALKDVYPMALKYMHYTHFGV